MCRAVASSWYLVSPRIKVVGAALVFPCPLDAPVPPVHYSQNIVGTKVKASLYYNQVRQHSRPSAIRFTQKLCFSKDNNTARSYSIATIFAHENTREFMVRSETGTGGEPF